MINKKLLFGIITVLVCVFSVSSFVTAARNGNSVSTGFWDKQGSSDNRTYNVQAPNNFQAYGWRVYGRYDGHGDLGHSGGKYGIDVCLNSSAVMWGSGACWAPVSSGGNGNVGGASNNFDFSNDIGASSNDFKYAISSYYINDLKLDATLEVSGRKMNINSLSSSNSTVGIGQQFDVNWSIDDVISNSTILTYNGPVNCDIGGSPRYVAPDGPGSGTTCTATGAGTANFTISSDGYSGSGTWSDSRNISVNVNAGFTDLNFYVKEQNNQPVTGATVTIDQNFGNGTTRNTDGGGFANFGVNKNVNINYTVSASGCTSVSGSKAVGNSSATVNVGMVCTAGGGGGGPPPVRQDAAGEIEAANCNAITGIAADPDDLTQSVDVYLFIDKDAYTPPAGAGLAAGPVKANIFRNDPFITKYGVSGNYGFSIPTPAVFKDGLTHTVYVHPYDLGGTGPNKRIIGSGVFTINCPVNPPTIPTIDSVDISSPTVVPNGLNQYTVTISGSDTNGGDKITYEYALLFDESDANNNTKYRGWLSWSSVNAFAGHKDVKACTGGGFGAIPNTGAYSLYGHRYINLVSCSTSVGVNSRTSSFVITFDPAYRTPLTGNDIEGTVFNSPSVSSGWRIFQDKFNLGFSSCAAFGTTNLAQGKTVTALVADNPPWNVGPASNLTDGNTGSQAYNGNVGQYYSVNLGGLTQISQIKTVLGAYGYTSPNVYVTSWNIDGKNSAGTWIPLAVGNNPESDNIYAYPSFDVSEIRVKTNSTTNWIGMFELEAYNCATSNVAPAVDTPLSSGVTNTSATVGATVRTIGVPPPLSGRGVCYSLSSAPTTPSLTNSATCIYATLSQTAPQAFTVSATGLNPGTTYKFRGFATNSIGTGYTAETSFNTSSPLPVVGLSANPASVASGNSSTLTWTISGATACSSIGANSLPVGNWSSGTTNNVGVSTGALLSSRTYQLSCTGPGGTTLSAPVTVSVAAPSTYTLNVTANPGPGGRIQSNIGGINCGAGNLVCSATYSSGDIVILSEIPTSSYWRFTGWTVVNAPACPGTGTCTVVVNAPNISVNASFAPRTFIYKEF